MLLGCPYLHHRHVNPRMQEECAEVVEDVSEDESPADFCEAELLGGEF